MKLIQWPLNERCKAIVLPQQKYFDDIKHAKSIDNELNAKGWQRDRDHHLCAQQRQHQSEGYYILRIYNTIYGYALGDTFNDGLGCLTNRGATAEMVLESAMVYINMWHGKVGILVEVFESKEEEFAAALAAFKPKQIA